MVAQNFQMCELDFFEVVSVALAVIWHGWWVRRVAAAVRSHLTAISPHQNHPQHLWWSIMCLHGTATENSRNGHCGSWSPWLPLPGGKQMVPSAKFTVVKCCRIVGGITLLRGFAIFNNISSICGKIRGPVVENLNRASRQPICLVHLCSWSLQLAKLP